MNKEEWEEIIERGAIILPSYELHRLAGPLYEADDDGQIDETKPVGEVPNYELVGTRIPTGISLIRIITITQLQH